MNLFNTHIKVLFCFVITILLTNCNKDKDINSKPIDKADTLSISTDTLHFDSEEDKKVFHIQSSLRKWNISIPNDVDWITFSHMTGNAGSTEVTATIKRNGTRNERTISIEIYLDENTKKTLTIQQSAAYFDNYNTNPIVADNTGMIHSAVDIANKISVGINIGNTLEATGGETMWGNPKITEDLIKLIKLNGFNAIRLPCSWYQYSDSLTAKIQPEWMARVKQVVDYCINNDIYVVLNIHWDGGWLENNGTTVKQKKVNARQRAFWEQIATEFRNYDERLLFASANEPNASNSEAMTVLLSYHQTFINAVRSTGGKNKYRTLIIQGPNTDIANTFDLMNELPTDSTANRLMMEVHYYSPFNFTLMTKDETWGKQWYYWGKNYHSTTDITRNASNGEESFVNSMIQKMKTKFVDKGIPVIIGEFGAIRRSDLTGDNLTLHLNSRAYFLQYVTKQAKANGMIPFYWDAGGIKNNGSAIFNRYNNTIHDQLALDALTK